MKKQLTVYNGGRKSTMKDVYEILTAEGDIVDVMRFDSPEEAAEFERGLVGGYLVKPHTLTAEELLDFVLDVRIDELLDVDRQVGSELMIAEEVASLVEKIKKLPEFQAKFKPSNTTIFGISVTSSESLSGDDSVFNFKTNEIEIYEELGGERIGGKFKYGEEDGFSYRNKDVVESEVLERIQASMQKFAGTTIDGYFQDE